MSYGDSNFIKADEDLFDKKSETNEKVHSRTPHTSFFKKLYGNLESVESAKNESGQNDDRINFSYNQAISAASDASGGSTSSDNAPRCVRLL